MAWHGNTPERIRDDWSVSTGRGTGAKGDDYSSCCPEGGSLPSFGLPVESAVSQAWAGWTDHEGPFGASSSTLFDAAPRFDTAAAARRGRAGVQHRPVDMPTDCRIDQPFVSRAVPCRSLATVAQKPRFLRSEARTQSPRTRRTRHPCLDRTRLAPAQKKAARCRGTLVFIDETGIFLTPFVRRTWALRGQTPTLRTRTRHHRHLSLIGAITISPRRRHLGWYLHFHANRSIRQQQVIAFLRDLLRHIHSEVFLIWDRLNAHRGKKVRAFLAHQPRLHANFLPPYAPELNPNEYGWAYLKCNPLANYAPEDLSKLKTKTKRAAAHIQKQQGLLRGFIRATGLPLRLPRRR
jgi:putative transposase